MQASISRRKFLGHAGAVGALVGAPAAVVDAQTQEEDLWSESEHWLETDYSAPAVHWAPNPDPEHLIPRGRGWRVRPTGGDDHGNLQWALRHTARRGVVHLAPGTFKIGSPIVVADFDGALVGSGAARTTITCTDEFSYELWEAPGGGRERGEPLPPPFPRASVNGAATRTPPVLIQFYKTPLQPGENPIARANTIQIRNFRVRGAMKGDLWAFGDEVLAINIVNSTDWHNLESAPATTRQDVLVSGIEVDGYHSPAFGPFENACACITVLGSAILTANYNLEGEVDGDGLGLPNGGLLGVTPAEGNVVFRSCTFRNCRLGPGVVGHKDSLIVFTNNVTSNCRGNCLQLLDNSGCRILLRGNDLKCDSFILPPQLVGGVEDFPSSLGCVAVIQGLAAAVGIASNLQWHVLANDAAAHANHPEAGPLGTWRPQGPSAVPQPSRFRILDNHCESSPTPNTYCLHIADAANLAFGIDTVTALVAGNGCEGAQTCISLEHIDRARVVFNDCNSQAFGVELHNAHRVHVEGNSFSFPAGVAGCEVRLLELGDKLDFSRVVPGAGVCVAQ